VIPGDKFAPDALKLSALFQSCKYKYHAQIQCFKTLAFINHDLLKFTEGWKLPAVFVQNFQDLETEFI